MGTEGAPGLIKQKREQVEEMIRGFQKRTRTLGPEEGVGHSEKCCPWMGAGSPAGAQWVGAAAACAVQTLGGGRAESWGGGEDSVTVSDLQ